MTTSSPASIPYPRVVSLLDHMEGRLMDMQKRAIEQQNEMKDMQRFITAVRGKAA